MLAPQVVQISDRTRLSDRELLRRISLGDGRLAVQLRDPQLPVRQLLAWGRRLRRATRQVGATLLVNDRLDVARLVDADGVHLGRTSVVPSQARELLGRQLWCSVSAHSLDDIDKAAAQGANAVLFSPVFASPGKTNLKSWDGLRAAIERAQRVGIDVYALGGVGLETAPRCLALGARGVASIRADLTALLHRGDGR